MIMCAETEFEILRTLISKMDKEPIEKVLMESFKLAHPVIIGNQEFMRLSEKKFKLREAKLLLKVISFCQKIDPMHFKEIIGDLLDIIYLYWSTKNRIRKLKKALKLRVLIFSMISSLLIAISFGIMNKISSDIFAFNNEYYLMMYAFSVFIIFSVVSFIISNVFFETLKTRVMVILISLMGMLTYIILTSFF